jgi:hypothetical protein
VALGFFYFMFVRTDQSLVGTWKGTDQYGHEHYFQFYDDGRMNWWDRDREYDGSFTQRGPFEGTYRKISAKEFLVKDYPILTPGLGKLTIIGPDQIQQDETGHISRHNLTYHRVGDVPKNDK